MRDLITQLHIILISRYESFVYILKIKGNIVGNRVILIEILF